MSKPRFLFFLYTLPPDPGSAPKRNFRIANALAKGSDFSLAFTAAAVSPEKNKWPSNFEVKEVKAIDYRKIGGTRKPFKAYQEKSKQNFISQSFIKLINTFPFSVLMGEGGLYYYFKLIRKGQQAILEKKITHIYSSFRPFADHYAAYQLKKKYPQLVWIADFRDLIIDPHYQHIYFQNWHHRFLKKMFATANVLTTVSNGLAEHLKSYNDQVVVLKNGILEEEIREIPPAKNPFFTIAYTGSMFLDKRNPKPLFQAIQELAKDGSVDLNTIRFINAGKDPGTWSDLARKYKMEHLLDLRGIVASHVAMEIQQQACINVLLTVSSDRLQGVLTGKFIEYVQAGNPVLAIVVGQNDPELKMALRELEIGDSFSDQPKDIPAIKDFVLKEYLAWKTTGFNRKAVRVEVVKTKYLEGVVIDELWKVISL